MKCFVDSLHIQRLDILFFFKLFICLHFVTKKILQFTIPFVQFNSNEKKIKWCYTFKRKRKLVFHSNLKQMSKELIISRTFIFWNEYESFSFELLIFFPRLLSLINNFIQILEGKNILYSENTDPAMKIHHFTYLIIWSVSFKCWHSTVSNNFHFQMKQKKKINIEVNWKCVYEVENWNTCCKFHYCMWMVYKKGTENNIFLRIYCTCPLHIKF